MSTTRTERLGSASSQCRTMRLHTPPSSEYRAAPGSARPHFGQRRAGMRGLTCASGEYPMDSVPGKALPSWSFSTNTGNRPSLNCWCRAHLRPVCRSMYMSVQTTRMNSRPEPCLLIFAALAFPSVILLCKGLPQPFPIMVCTLSIVSKPHYPWLRFDLALRGLHGPGFDMCSRSQHVLLTHGFPRSSSASADLNCCPRPATSHTSEAAASLARNRCTSRVSLIAAALAGPAQGLTVGKLGRFSCTGGPLAGRRSRWRWTGLPSRSNTA